MLVLFIDDDPDDYEIFCEALKGIDVNARCVQAFDCEEAIQMLNDFAVGTWLDFIFLDVNMPKIDGQECLKTLKGSPRLKDIPVILFSSSSNLVDIDKIKQLGARKFVIKPPSINEIRNVLKGILSE